MARGAQETTQLPPKDGPRMLDTWIHPCRAERHARVCCSLFPPILEWALAASRMATPSCQALPPQTLVKSLACVLSPRLLLAASSSTISSPHSRTLLILRGTRMDPTCWQPEKGCPAVGLTWVCWHS
ncbi:hypothetical protein V8C26DRAFT_289177 [Trichoderma gracile]